MSKCKLTPLFNNKEKERLFSIASNRSNSSKIELLHNISILKENEEKNILSKVFSDEEKEKLFYECCMKSMESEVNEKIKKLQKRY